MKRTLTVRLQEGFGSRGIVAAGILFGLGLTAASILASPYKYDDTANVNIRANLAHSGNSVWDLIVFYTNTWIQSEGRFFPGSVTWTFGVFYLFNTRIEYKVVLVVVLVAAMSATAWLVYAITRSKSAAAVIGLLLVGTVSIRLYFDGIISFTGLLPLTAALSIGACALLITRGGIATCIVAATAYLVALFTYETVTLFAPAMIAAIAIMTRSWRRTIPVIVPALVEVVLVIALRSKIASPAPAYAVSLDPGPILVTFIKQFLAAVPGSQWWLGNLGLPGVPVPLIFFCAFVVGVPTFLAAREMARSRVSVRRPQQLLLAGFGLWIWASSSALVAVTLRWQIDLPWGQGYLSVVYGYLGLALCLVATWLCLSSYFAGRWNLEARQFHWWMNSSAVAIALLCSLTVAANLSTAN